MTADIVADLRDLLPRDALVERTDTRIRVTWNGLSRCYSPIDADTLLRRLPGVVGRETRAVLVEDLHAPPTGLRRRWRVFRRGVRA
jgi:hypothetical protein